MEVGAGFTKPGCEGSIPSRGTFPDRDTLVNMVVTMKGVSFPQPGIFPVELLLVNQWVADTTVELI
jgi:hypothetical protein